MAEYVLGRIKFVYQGAWTTSTGYVIDDVVTVSGKTFICVLGHTASSTFATDESTKWKLVADGVAWRSTWAAATLYNKGDLAKYGAIVYQCNTAHTSANSTLGLENDQGKWDIFANGTNYRSTWATTTRYYTGDLVTYGGYVYYCATGHISAATATLGLENNQGNWQTFNAGITYLGTWTATTRYKINDIVKNGGNTYICVLNHTSSSSIDVTGTYFQTFAEGLQFESSWSGATAYQIGDLVTYGGYTYVAIQNGTNQNPSTANSYWTPITTGWSYQGDWTNTTSYKISQVVRLNGYTYLTLTDSPSYTVTTTATTITGNLITVSDTTGLVIGMSVKFASSVGGLTGGTTYYVKTIPTPGASGTITVSLTAGGTAVTITANTTSQSVSTVASAQPGNASYWTRLNPGLYWTNPTQSYTTVTTSNVTVTNGAATGAQYTVLRSNTAYTLTRTANGSNYTTGDIVKILGTAVGGISPANDITVTLTASAGAITAQTSAGTAVTWTAGTNYVLGDVATFGANSYVSIVPHTGDAAVNRPDVDIAGTYWNILSAGAEVATLSAAGDTLYYGSNGPARLPIGLVGQVLRSTGTYPQWANWGQINNVVYVGPSGTDAPAPTYGLTMDNPFASVWYAAKQVELGYMYPNARQLLTVNKQFAMKEINNYLSYTYKAAITGTATSTFTTASTAGLYQGMPVRFGSLTGSLTINAVAISTSTTYYVRDIVASTSFTVSATVGGVAVSIAGTGTAVATYDYDTTRAERDAGLILEGVAFDMSHGGTSKTVANALAYYTYGSTLASGVYAYDITAFSGALNYLSTLFSSILGNTAPASNYQTLNSAASPATQQINTSYTTETGAVTVAQGLVGIVTTGLNGGSTSFVPTPIYPQTSINVKTGTYNEVLPIVLPAYTAIIGDELRSTVVQPSTAVATMATDKAKMVAVLNRIKTIAPTLIANSAVSATSGNTTTQVTTLTAGSVGSSTAVSSVVSNGQNIYSIINSGLGSVPVFSFTNPTGYNASYLVGYGDGKAQIVQNYNFLSYNIAQYFATNNAGMWTALGAGGQTNFRTQITYILDALQYDMTYGGNTQSLIAGSAYWAYYTFAVAITGYTAAQIKTAYASAFTELKAEVANIVTTTAQSQQAGQSTYAQVTTGTAGSGGASTFAQARVQDVIDWINNGVANATTTPSASIALASSALQTAYTAVQNVKTEIQNDVTGWVKKYYQSLSFDSAICYRDAGYMVDALSYDLVLGSNFATAIAARRYYTHTVGFTDPSANTVIASQKAATLGAFNFVLFKIKNIAASGASETVKTIIDDVTNNLNATGYNGSLLVQMNGSVTYNNVLGIVNGAEILRINKSFIQSEATAYLTASYGGMVTATTISGDLFTTSANHNFVAGDPVVFSGATYTGSGVVVGTTYYVLATGLTSTAFSVSATVGGTAIDVTTNNSAGTTLFVRYVFTSALVQKFVGEFVDAFAYDLQYIGNYRSLRAATYYLNYTNGSITSDMFYVRNGTGLRNMTWSGLTGTLGSANSFGTKRPTAGAYTSLDPGFGPYDSNAWTTTRSCYVQNVTTFGFGCVGCKIDGALHAGGNRSIVSNDFTQVLSDGIGVWCTGSNALTELVSVFSYYGYAGYLAELGGKIRATNGNSSYGTYGVIAEGVDSYETPLYATLNNRAAQALIGTTITDGINQILRFEYTNAGSNYTNASYTINGAGYNAAATGDEFRDLAVFETRVQDNNDATGIGQIGGYNHVTSANTAQAGAIGTITIAASDTALSAVYAGMQIIISAGTGVGQFAQILNYNSGTKVANIVKPSFVTLTVTATTNTGDLLTVANTATLYANMPIYLGTAVGGVGANTLYYVKTISSSTQFTISTSSGGATFDVTSDTSAQTVSLYAAGWDNVVPGKSVNNSIDLTSTYTIEPRLSYSAPGYTATARTLSATATWKNVCFGGGSYLAVANGSTSSAYSNNGTTWASAGALTGSTTQWQEVLFGGGYGAAATVTIGGLGGSGAVLTAVISGGVVTSITVTSGGNGYLTAPTLTISGGSGSGAQATCAVLNGAIAGVTVTVNGSGYATAPTVSVNISVPTAISMTAWGNDYTSAPTVAISDPFTGTLWTSAGASVASSYYYYTTGSAKNWYQATSTAGLGTVAPTHTTGTAGSNSNLTYVGTTVVGTPTLSNLGVSSIAITTAGAGYTAVPTVTITDANAKYVAISATSTATAYQTPTGAVATTAWTAGGVLPSSTWSSMASGVYGGSTTWMAVGSTAAGAVTNDGVTWTTKALPTLGSGTYSSVSYGNGTFIAVSTGNSATAIYSSGTWVAGGTLPSSATWTSIAYGNGRFVAVASGGTTAAYSLDNGVTWLAAPAGLPVSTTWSDVEYGQGLFFAMATGTNNAATSQDGINWVARTMPSSSAWSDSTFGNVNGNPLWVAVSNTSGTTAASIRTGATPQGRAKVVGVSISEIRMAEPGSGYPRATVTATTTSTNIITTADTTNLVDSQPIEFTGLDAYGLATNTIYFVIGSTIVTNTSFKVSATAGSATAVNITTGTGLAGVYTAGPIVTIVDPNKTKSAVTRVRMGIGAMGQPSFSNRGTGNSTATATSTGDGYADVYQANNFIAISGLYSAPTAGANVTFASIPNTYFKLVQVLNLIGTAGNYTATFQINPSLSTLNAPAHADAITTRLKYSQTRLTGHDFLYIGTGNQVTTNYPSVNVSTAITANQQAAYGGGRVFFTSTDQDGNFNVGNLFSVQQSTGTATLNATAFNLSGLQSLQLGSVTVGSGSATITQFSTDAYFTANSDNVLPTQRAIKSYITSQIGGGQSSLNVNTLTSGVVYIANNTITTTTGVGINVKAKMNFTGGVDGAPVAMQFFLQR